MKRTFSAAAFAAALLGATAAHAQQCLHGQGETPDQAARRREALTATRTVNNLQANQPGRATKTYLRHADESHETVMNVLKLETILRRAGLGPKRLAVAVHEGAGHTESAWAQRLPIALEFLFGRS